MAVLAPIPSASDSTATTAEHRGFLQVTKGEADIGHEIHRYLLKFRYEDLGRRVCNFFRRARSAVLIRRVICYRIGYASLVRITQMRLR